MKFLGFVMCGLALMSVTGCRFDRHKGADNKNDDVKFATPFGGMSVKTDTSVVQEGVGLSVYPGAVAVKKEGKSDGAADVNFSFGSFHLGVKALAYQSADAPEKVLAFYRKDMAHFGTVILCRGHQPVGTPARTQEGLSCDSESKDVHVNDDEDSDEELKAGSKQHQHIVSIKPKDGGTKIGLVALELPGGLGGDEDKN